jgi:hypothetical protein
VDDGEKEKNKKKLGFSILLEILGKPLPYFILMSFFFL